MTTTISGELGAQSTAADKPGVPGGQTGGEGAAASAEAQALQADGQQAKGEGETDGEASLSPELEEAKKNLLRDYHEKTQKLAEDRRLIEAQSEAFKRDAEFFQSLAQQDWFKQALKAEKARRSGQSSGPIDISDETFEKVREGDKRAFQEAVISMAKSIVDQRLAGLPSKEEVDQLKTDREFERLASDKDFTDFREMNDKGLLDPFLQKNLDYESAYARAKLEQSRVSRGSEAERVRQEAEKLIQQRKTGAVHTTGTTQVRGGKVMKIPKGTSFDQAFDDVFKAIEGGNKDLTVEVER